LDNTYRQTWRFELESLGWKSEISNLTIDLQSQRVGKAQRHWFLATSLRHYQDLGQCNLPWFFDAKQREQQFRHRKS
jgi:hypothetical protein